MANRIHDGMSPIAFFAALCGIAAIGVAMRRIDGWRGLGHYSLVTSALGLILMLGLVQSLASRTFTGLWQRLFLITVFSWCGVVGLRLFSKHPAIQRSNP